jgi:large subunit ribosomal protein L15e
MALYKYLRETWKKRRETDSKLWTNRMTEWSTSNSTVRIERPTRLDRARSLGYRAKTGFILLRQRVPRNKRQRVIRKKGKRSKHSGVRLNLDKSYQVIAEQRSVKKYPNCEVLNSYYLANNGKYFWYEVILVDRAHPQILSDSRINWISRHKGRVHRGLTSAAKKSRGLRGKGKGYEKMRPSKTANRNRRKE